MSYRMGLAVFWIGFAALMGGCAYLADWSQFVYTVAVLVGGYTVATLLVLALAAGHKARGLLCKS